MSFGAATVNGVIYCLGGSSGGDGQFSTCSSVQHKYNVNTNTWDTVRVQDGFAYFWFNGTQACVVNNKIYFGGARFDNPAALSEYDPATKTFIRDITQFPGGHRYQGMVAIGNDIYVVGGNTGGGKAYGTPASALARTDIYNLTSGTWKAGPNLPTPAWGCGAVVLNGKIYIVGGHNSTTYLANLQELTVAQKAVYFHAKN
jgi:N-acetylneuraminic acid mutarotase